MRAARTYYSMQSGGTEMEWFENCEGKGREKTRGDEHRRMKPVPRKAPYRGRRGTNLFAPRRLRNSNLPAPLFQPSFRRSLWVFLNAPHCSPSARKRRDSVGGKFRFYFPRMRQSPRALFHISFNRISFNYSSTVCATPRNQLWIVLTLLTSFLIREQ